MAVLGSLERFDGRGVTGGASSLVEEVVDGGVVIAEEGMSMRGSGDKFGLDGAMVLRERLVIEEVWRGRNCNFNTDNVGEGNDPSSYDTVKEIIESFSPFYDGEGLGDFRGLLRVVVELSFLQGLPVFGKDLDDMLATVGARPILS
jgi:hypothetical protein